MSTARRVAAALAVALALVVAGAAAAQADITHDVQPPKITHDI